MLRLLRSPIAKAIAAAVLGALLDVVLAQRKPKKRS